MEIVERTTEIVLTRLREEPTKKFRAVDLVRDLRIPDRRIRKALSSLMYHREIDSMEESSDILPHPKGRGI